ncbi:MULTISPECIES: ankyrin repeat domain-containing protein [Bacillus cereus group]|uniref:ankyrin repeat domain-containing protein n=1 Tax=Bacillus cereus group TaxID=86661 RepID=UPI001F48C560|nr:ankyrin repeat domain-containing protein [Bacillus cereus]MDA1521243.1 ankyrin repeat domain-containing protein [Bacillus cereus]BCC09336.1 hypothetical protein BCM0060_p2002 [Bacillus cereus]BCC16546.1 hypothetical protein BCM0075_1316 [Bacillus cereus]HDR7981616.1 ankyrin repeat domain-containing protein [Bacillus cereus]HDR8059631.1 ankyrin repeat domain-containing protein [Bacillus cereus]
MLETYKDHLIEEVKIKLQNRRSLNVKFKKPHYNPMTYLYYFLHYGSVAEFEWLLINGADPNVLPKKEDNRSLLTYAVQLESKEESFQKSKLLLDYGAKVNFGGKRKSPPIFYSVHYEVTKLLIDFGADVNSSDGYDSVIKIAVSRDDVDMVKILLENGAEITNPQTLLSIAIHKDSFEMLSFLLNYINIDSSQIAPAISKAKPKIIQLLLDNGMNPINTIEFILKTKNSFLDQWPKKRDVLNQLLNEISDKDIKYFSAKKLFLFQCETISLLEPLLYRGFDINVRGDNNDTPVIRAVKNKNYHLVNFYIENGANIYLQDNEGNTILHILLKQLLNKKNEWNTNEVIDTIQKLLVIWDDFTIANNKQQSILSLIKRVKQPSLIKTLVELGYYFPSYLKFSIENEKYDLLELMIKKDLIPNNQGQLVNIFVSIGNLEVLKMLIKKGFYYNTFALNILKFSLRKNDICFAQQILLDNYDTLYQHSDEIITYSLQTTSLQFIRFLLDNNYRPSKTLFDVLRIATMEKDLEMIKDILDNHSEDKSEILNFLKDEKGNTLGHLACLYNNYEILVYFLKNGLDTTQRNTNEETIIETIISNDCFKLEEIEGILGLVDINQRDERGLTPFIKCCSKSDISLVKLLINYGADINAISNDGITPIVTAYKNNDINMFELLLNFEADPNGYFNKYREVTLLMQSILDAKRCIANMLINAGSNINLSDSEGNTALHFAYKISDSKMIKYLLDKGADPNKRNNLKQLPIYTNKSYR